MQNRRNSLTFTAHELERFQLPNVHHPGVSITTTTTTISAAAAPSSRKRRAGDRSPTPPRPSKKAAALKSEETLSDDDDDVNKNEADEANECSICMSEYKNPASLSDCSHTFCAECIQQWSGRSKKLWMVVLGWCGLVALVLFFLVIKLIHQCFLSLLTLFYFRHTAHENSCPLCKTRFTHILPKRGIPRHVMPRTQQADTLEAWLGHMAPTVRLAVLQQQRRITWRAWLAQREQGRSPATAIEIPDDDDDDFNDEDVHVFQLE